MGFILFGMFAGVSCEPRNQRFNFHRCRDSTGRSGYYCGVGNSGGFYVLVGWGCCFGFGGTAVSYYPPMSPAVSYYGGKQRLASRIVEQCLKIPHTVYCEPYCGGAAVYFAMPVMYTGNNDHYRVVLNDIDERLITFYRVAQTRTDELLTMLRGTLYSKADYDRSADILRNPAGYDELTRAWAYYVNISQSFSFKLLRGWKRGIFGQNHANVWISYIDALQQTLEKLKMVYAECGKALDCIDQWNASQVLLYLDPPYPEADQGHYGGFTIDDWAELCAKLDSCQSSYILSNYPQSVEPTSAQQRLEIKATMSASGAGKVNGDRSRKATAAELGNRERTEVLWICDRSAGARDELKPVFKRLQASIDRPLQVDLFGDTAA